jgi:hypothetical protein
MAAKKLEDHFVACVIDVLPGDADPFQAGSMGAE